jgi:hypothetical protein
VKSFPLGFKDEVAKRRGARPVWILTFTVAGAEYCISDMVIAIPTWHGGITTKAWVTQWGEINEQVSGSLNEIRISDFSLSLLSDPDDVSNINHLATEHNLEAAQCRLYLWFIGITDPPQEFFRGYVRDLSTPDYGMTWTLTLEDEASRMYGNYGEVLTQEVYPNCLANHVGRLLPVVFGTAYRVMPPVAKVVSPNYYYYAFGCTLDSVSQVMLRGADGTLTELLSGSYVFYSGRTGNEYSFLPGRAVIRTAASTATAITGTQVATFRATDKTMVAGIDYLYPGGSVWNAVQSAVDSDDSSYTNAVGNYGTWWYKFSHALTAGTVARVKSRIKLFTNTACTVEIINQSSITIASYSVPVSPDGTVIDTGWIDATGVTSVTVKFSCTLAGYPTIKLYAAWLDVEYSVQTGTSYADNPTDILVTATRRELVQTIAFRPNTSATSSMYFSIGNEANMRDASTSTYAFMSPSMAGATANGTWSSTATLWANAISIVGLATRFRIGANVALQSAGTITIKGGILNGAAWTYTQTVLTYPSTGTFYSPWAPSEFNGVLSQLMAQIILAPNSGTLWVYDMWIEVEFGDSPPDYVTSALLGQTVTGTWTALPASYRLNGAIVDSRRMIDWLDYLAYQCRCWFRISCGVARLIWRPDVLIYVAAIPAVRVESGRKMWTRKRAAKTDVVNSLTLRYARDYSMSGDEAYGKISSSSDSASISDFGELSRDELFKMDFCTQDQHAQSVRDFYLSTLKDRYWLEDLVVYLDQIALEFGDVVQLPDLRLGMVVSVGIQPGSIDQMDRIKLTVMV